MLTSGGSSKDTPPPASVEAFYDDFSRRFVEDIVQGNERVAQQLLFFGVAIPPDAHSILVIGSGSGESAFFIAQRLATSARILAVDISSENIRFSEALFAHPRVTYRRVDVVHDSLEGSWDVIVLPDVYEHIPQDSRQTLHATLKGLISSNGRILLTIPSPGYQKHLYAVGTGLQIVDEIVTLHDLTTLATEVGGVVTYFCMKSIWLTNDYIHAVVERSGERVAPIEPGDKTPLKGWPRRTFWKRLRGFAHDRLGFERFGQFRRRTQINRKLSRRTATSVLPSAR